VYTEKLKGSLSMDMLIYAKEKGLDAEFYRGGLEDLKARIREGRPLILFLNLGHELYPVGHYVVVLGYNDKMEVVIAHSGKKSEEVLPYRSFLRSWEKTGFSTLLIKPGEDTGEGRR
ncbi:MAG: hypothetical protein V3W31_09160, partial [Thermodesulfobacteriota bacterium]